MKETYALLAPTAIVCFWLAACTDPRSMDQPSTDRLNDLAEESTSLPVRLDLEHKIDIVAALANYDDEVTWHHVDGYKFSYFKIIEPFIYADKSLVIRHEKSPDPNSHWRNVGMTFRIRIAEEVLEMSVGADGYIGAGSVENLEELPTIPRHLTTGDRLSMGSCWQKLVAKFERVGFEGLSESERVYLLVRIADAEVNRGGFHAICNSPIGEYGSRLAYAFAVIGATRKAGLFDELNRIFGDEGLPKGILKRQTVHSELSASNIEVIDTFGTRYLGDQNAIDILLQEWGESEGMCLLAE